MGIAAAVVSGFVLAAVAPAVYRVARGAAGWLLALLPLGLFVYFASFLGKLPAEGITFNCPWVPSLGIRFSFLLDGLSLLFALLISGIGAIILVYAGGYLAGHRQLGRMHALLLIFMASMLGVVLADNVLTLFIFWELTSLSSYFLIGFDHERAAARAAALQALLVTGAGSLALLAGLLLLGQAGADVGLAADRCFELSALVALQHAIQGHTLYLPILVLVLCGAFTKSAQVPFHFWLPSAMEAPTPVSAYLHSATMVKAGVYLLARLSPVLGGTEEWLLSVTAFGGATMLVGAILAVQETDLKRILAYSTVSALGLLVMLLGIGTAVAVAAAMTFLLAHALYKGALFLVAGAIDHGTGTRDVEHLSGLAKAMPVTAVAAVIAALSMAALPPLFGFVAKELVYEATLHAPAVRLITTVAVIASMLFVVVALVVGVRPFVGRPTDQTLRAHEVSASLWLGPMLLAGLSLALGLVPTLVDAPLLALASGATLQAADHAPLELALWHGWNLTLALSGLTLAGGLAGFLAREKLRILPPTIANLGPDRAYQLALAGLNGLARRQTAILQSGYLRLYLLTILLTAVGLVGYALLVRNQLALTLDWSDIRFHEAALGVIAALATLATILSRSRLSGIAALGTVGYCVALIFVLYGAPDLAMTQFLVETLTVILFVLVFYHLSPAVTLSGAPTRIRDGVVAVAVGALMTLLVLISVQTHFFPTISSYYSENSVEAGHGRNIVNVILVDYRALDTLGEITVLGVAGVGVYALLKLRSGGGSQA